MHTRVLLLTAALWIAPAALAAEQVRLNIRPGLWEMASQSQLSGSPIPGRDLSGLTPEQRARMEAAMQAGMANAAKPHVSKLCLTPEKIAKGLDLDAPEKGTCERKIIRNSGSELALTETCQREGSTTVMDEHFQLSGSDQIAGTMHMVRTQGGRTMTIDRKMSGKWLGASCGDVKDFEIEH